MRKHSAESGEGLFTRSRSPEGEDGGVNRNAVSKEDLRQQMHYHQRELERIQRLLGKVPNPLDGRRRTRHSFREWRWIKGSRIGGGTFGEVFKGIETTTGRLVAGKAIPLPTADQTKDPNSTSLNTLRALRKEIKIMKDLQHPNIVRYYRAEIIENHFYIFMEYVPGGSLRALLDETGPLSLQLAAKFTRFIAVGLEYLHDKTVVHRDVKAANVLVDVDGVLKLADFGSAQLFSRVQGLHGTVLWMAPEVIRGEEDLIGPKADVWSLGCTLLEMLTGKTPFLDYCGSMVNVAAFLAGDDPVPIPAEIVDADARHFLKMCFTRNPKRRPTISQLRTHPFLLQLETHTADAEGTTTSSARQSIIGAGSMFSAVRSALQSTASKSGSKAPSATRTSRSNDIVTSRFLENPTNDDLSPQEESLVRNFLVKRALNGSDVEVVDRVASIGTPNSMHPLGTGSYPEISRAQIMASVAMDVRNDVEAEVLVLPGGDVGRRRRNQSLVNGPLDDGNGISDLPEETLSDASSLLNSSDTSSVISTLSERVRRHQEAATRVVIPQRIREAVLHDEGLSGEGFTATFWPPSAPCVLTCVVSILVFAVCLVLVGVLVSVL